jgi:hypothetical protein
MSEWLKEHAWKACVGETLPWVRIPLSPPEFTANPRTRSGQTMSVTPNQDAQLRWRRVVANARAAERNTAVGRPSPASSCSTDAACMPTWRPKRVMYIAFADRDGAAVCGRVVRLRRRSTRTRWFGGSGTSPNESAGSARRVARTRYGLLRRCPRRAIRRWQQATRRSRQDVVTHDAGAERTVPPV